tara:strand:+ start:154 stop:348 length:195 start_codon:yes stop_codon:yes gene_type:complete
VEPYRSRYYSFACFAGHHLCLHHPGDVTTEEEEGNTSHLLVGLVKEETIIQLRIRGNGTIAQTA